MPFTSDNESRAVELAASLRQSLEHPVITGLLRRLSARTPLSAPVSPSSKEAAVIALLRVVPDTRYVVELLFIKRAERTGDPWSGHIAFPGGRRDPTDESLQRTALRETLEELSIDVEQYGKILGQLDDLAPNSRSLPPIIVRPFVAVIPATLPHRGNHEVADTFWTPIAHLRSAESRAEHELLVNGVSSRFPAYAVGSHRVWGLTERIVSQLLPLFAPDRGAP